MLICPAQLSSNPQGECIRKVTQCISYLVLGACSHEMVTIVKDLLVQLLELNNVCKDIFKHMLRVLGIVRQLIRHTKDVCALPGPTSHFKS